MKANKSTKLVKRTLFTYRNIKAQHRYSSDPTTTTITLITTTVSDPVVN